MMFSQSSMGRKQDSMVDKTALGYGLIPEMLGPILVRCSMSLRTLWEA